MMMEALMYGVTDKCKQCCLRKCAAGQQVDITQHAAGRVDHVF